MRTRTSLIGRDDEFDALKGHLDNAMSGQGSTIFVSGNAGIGKTRLIDEFHQYADDRKITILRSGASAETKSPFMIISKALEDMLEGPLFREQEHISFTELFAVNRAGLLVAQAAPDEGLDADIFSGMLSAVQDFVRDSFDPTGEQKGSLGRLEYGDMKILMEHGEHLFLTGVFKGTEHADMKLRLKEAVKEIEEEHGDLFASWDGKMEDMMPIQEIVSGLSQVKFLVRRDLQDVDLENERLIVADTVLETLSKAPKPLLLLLEDLHWADESSLFVLHYLARNITEDGVMILGTMRPDESPGLQSAVEEMNTERILTELKLDRLEAGCVSSLVDEAYPENDFPPTFLDSLATQCDGNPFFLLEMLWQMKEDGSIQEKKGGYTLVTESYSIPGTIEDVVYNRLEVLGPEAMSLVEFASCVGREFSTACLSSMPFLRDAPAAIEMAQETGMIKVLNGTAEFSHAIFQDVTYRSINDRWRATYHKSIGEYYESAYSGKLDQVLYELARHFSRSGEKGKTYDYCIRAAEKTESAFAPEQAIEFYESALDAAPSADSRIQILERLGDVHGLRGDFTAAIDRYNSALQDLDDDRSKAELHRKVAENLLKLAKSEDALVECEKGFSLLDKEAEESARLQLTKGWIYSKMGDYDKAGEFFMSGLEMASSLNLQKERGQAFHSLGTTAWYKGDYDEAIQHFEKAIEIHENIGNLNELAGSLNNIGSVYHFQGDRATALVYKERAYEMYKKVQNKFGIGTSLNNIGIVHYDQGELDKCLELWDECLALRKSIGDRHGLATTLHNIGGVYHEKDEYDRAIEYYKEGLEINIDIGSKLGMVYDLCSLSKAYLDTKNVDNAMVRAREALDICIEMGTKGEEAWSRRLIGASYREMGELEKAMEYSTKAMEIFTESGEKEEIANCHMEFGFLHKALGDVVRSKESFETALEMYREMGIKLDAERVKTELEKLVIE